MARIVLMSGKGGVGKIANGFPQTAAKHALVAIADFVSKRAW